MKVVYHGRFVLLALILICSVILTISSYRNSYLLQRNAELQESLNQRVMGNLTSTLGSFSWGNLSCRVNHNLILTRRIFYRDIEVVNGRIAAIETENGYYYPDDSMFCSLREE